MPGVDGLFESISCVFHYTPPTLTSLNLWGVISTEAKLFTVSLLAAIASGTPSLESFGANGNFSEDTVRIRREFPRLSKIKVATDNPHSLAFLMGMSRIPTLTTFDLVALHGNVLSPQLARCSGGFEVLQTLRFAMSYLDI
ncbi:unnamed protein product [Cyclocybe aegerita]|uniref:Uncharacterized protein n=1 Tax=Cyclocybe aegerita TaxID=1973307 RepID=A0A8S0VZA2_CYCAE|nr:unnamed protein product [Cyclocybe aegerita]